MPAFHEWRPEAARRVAISSSGFSTKLATWKQPAASGRASERSM